MLLYLQDKMIFAIKRNEPKFLTHVGRKWTKTKILIDGKKFECTFDSRLGRCIYFQYKNRWHSISMYSDHCDKVQYSFNPLLSTIEFKTTKSVVINTKSITVHNA